MVTPVTANGRLDEAAFTRVIDLLLAAGVEGIFVMGTTGEGKSIPESDRRKIVELAVARAKGATVVFAGIGDGHRDGITAGNDYLRAGADALVCRPPTGMAPEAILPWFQKLLDGLQGPLLLYNMPMTSKVSIPLEVIEKLQGHPQLAGIKDSENNLPRLEELMRQFGGKADFSVFVGVGALMIKGLQLGADGIVPSVGNLIPEICHQLCAAATAKDWVQAENHFSRMNTVAALYQNGRTLNESLSVLKAAMHCRGLCAPHVLPPLRPLSESQMDKLRGDMGRLQLLENVS